AVPSRAVRARARARIPIDRLCDDAPLDGRGSTSRLRLGFQPLRLRGLLTFEAQGILLGPPGLDRFCPGESGFGAEQARLELAQIRATCPTLSVQHDGRSLYGNLQAVPARLDTLSTALLQGLVDERLQR